VLVSSFSLCLVVVAAAVGRNIGWVWLKKQEGGQSMSSCARENVGCAETAKAIMDSFMNKVLPGDATKTSNTR
jgi:hypothetical protein